MTTMGFRPYDVGHDRIEWLNTERRIT